MILKRSHDVNGPDEELGKMRRASRIPITELNPYITCTLCKGYFIDATTIIECLHTFCRSCIVKYLETNKYCPVCDVQVHKSKPLVNIRPDKTLQDVVYKLVPRLFQNEMQRRREFYKAHPEVKPSGLEQRGEASYQHLLSPEETICLSLNYHESTGPPRYLRCPAAVSIAHLQKLIRAKYDLNDFHRIDVLHNQDTLHSYLTLMDVAYIYLWRRKGPLELTYRIYENRTKRIKIDGKDDTEDKGKTEETDDAKSEDVNVDNTNNNNNWKEVQLRISENGEISVTDIVQDTTDTERTVSENNLPEINYVIETSTASGLCTTVGDCTTSCCASTTSTVTNVGDIVTETTESKVSALKNEPEANTLLSANETKAIEEVITTTTNVTDNSIKITTTAVQNTIVTDNITVTTISPSVSTTNDIVTVTTTTSESSSLIDNTVAVVTCSTNTNTTTNNSLSLSTACSLVTVSSHSLTTIIEKSLPVVITTVTKPLCSANTKTVTATSTMSAATLSSSSNPKLDVHYKVPVVKIENKALKHKLDNKNAGEPPAKQPKQTILNHTLGLHKLSNNHPLKKHSQMSNDLVPVSGPKPSILEVTSAPTIINKSLNTQLIRPGTPSTHKWKSSTPGPPPCYVPKPTYSPIINVPKVQASASKISDHKSHTMHNNVKGPEQNKSQTAHGGTILNNKGLIKSKPSTPIGYKTLRDPPKTWNPQISRAHLNRNAPDAKCAELKNVRPPKFFKLRNNMPRYLGNPASGVKPMYQVHLSPEKEKADSKPDKSEIKKHSIVKIDPKTLKPISERAPETSNLSRTSETKYPEQDLKINASSVSIFNPLKLQSSPKGDRKSPKSPHSPKNKSSSPPNRREKLNLSFTPPNPFIPNLTSPTMSPNQFLFSSGPPGFPSYDPRVMAAYHTFLYGQQRMAFNASSIPGLNLDLNQRNNFDLVSPTSPKLIQNKPQTETTSINNSTMVVTASTSNHHNSHKNNAKKSKESNKSEKSLQNAVEKLTQNKIKEVARINEKELSNETSKELSKVDVTKDNKGDKSKSVDGIKVTTDSKKTEQQSKDDKKLEKEQSPVDDKKTKENSDTNNIKDKTESKVVDKESTGVVNNNNSTDSAANSMAPISEKGK